MPQMMPMIWMLMLFLSLSILLSSMYFIYFFMLMPFKLNKSYYLYSFHKLWKWKW